MTDQILGWRFTTIANVANGTKDALSFVIRVADETAAREAMSKALGGITQFHAEPLSAEDVEDYGLAEGKWKRL